MPLNVLIISSLLTASLMQIEWKGINALAKKSESMYFSKEKAFIPSSQMPFLLMMKVKEDFDFKNLICPILDKSNFIIFMKFFLFHLWTFL